METQPQPEFPPPNGTGRHLQTYVLPAAVTDPLIPGGQQQNHPAAPWGSVPPGTPCAPPAPWPPPESSTPRTGDHALLGIGQRWEAVFSRHNRRRVRVGPKPVEKPEVPGAVAAALLAAGVAAAVFGMVIVLGEASDTVAGWLNFYGPVGPLSGKTIVATVAYLFGWHLLHERMRVRTVRFRRVLSISLGLLATGVLLTFPPVYGALAHILPIP